MDTLAYLMKICKLVLCLFFLRYKLIGKKKDNLNNSNIFAVMREIYNNNAIFAKHYVKPSRYCINLDSMLLAFHLTRAI